MFSGGGRPKCFRKIAHVSHAAHSTLETTGENAIARVVLVGGGAALFASKDDSIFDKISGLARSNARYNKSYEKPLARRRLWNARVIGASGV